MSTWTWANLDDRGLELVHETERTLGVDVLVFDQATGGRAAAAPPDLAPAPLDASQIECLEGVEQRVGGVAIAYRRS